MPNRGELAMPVVRAAKAQAESSDAWTIIGFCAIGWLMSIFLAVSTLGVDGVPRLMAQFPGLM
jgi:disulfide bond formation protein DsbB